MRTSVAALALLFLLLVASFSLTIAAPRGVDTSPCCPRHSSKVFPKRIVKSFFYTSGNCNLPSVVFVFKDERHKPGCADPQATWVKDLMEHLKQA
ncbi:C-C motif chemokine 5-like [Rhineura floridana]|uniref:C-C motif chemokine 5-like n=1 Tax=Rhineura floridana TaxID=261503 RepID=UPI002AC83525|nr:C-C motif chemokine 5-like [Rhineura floridana]